MKYLNKSLAVKSSIQISSKNIIRLLADCYIGTPPGLLYKSLIYIDIIFYNCILHQTKSYSDLYMKHV